MSMFSIQVMDYDCEMDVPVMRADKRFFLLNQRSPSNDQWGIVSDVTINNGVTYITLRSIIQVANLDTSFFTCVIFNLNKLQDSMDKRGTT